MNVFVDPSAGYALFNRRDDFHGAAARILRRLRDEAARLVPTNRIVVETTALVAARLGRAAARRWLADLLPVAEVLWVDRGVHGAAVAAFLGADGGVSLVDLVSFEVMRRMGLQWAFACDEDFSRHGFEVLQESWRSSALAFCPPKLPTSCLRSRAALRKHQTTIPGGSAP
ncbi:type II toxin-antitoxin system VapC family toxin [Thermoflexus sp.]|uniref:type II toxin-antitoxin system VapC family toxin n=1 Tax=Thermoflexus sp. TaxID=1969742 RepID=UPI0035E403B1